MPTDSSRWRRSSLPQMSDPVRAVHRVVEVDRERVDRSSIVPASASVGRSLGPGEVLRELVVGLRGMRRPPARRQRPPVEQQPVPLCRRAQLRCSRNAPHLAAAVKMTLSMVKSSTPLKKLVPHVGADHGHVLDGRNEVEVDLGRRLNHRGVLGDERNARGAAVHRHRLRQPSGDQLQAVDRRLEREEPGDNRRPPESTSRCRCVDHVGSDTVAGTEPKNCLRAAVR